MNPPPFDLGNLAALKLGDEVTTITREGQIGSTVFLVHAIDGERVRVRRPEKANATGSWLIRNGGGCPYAMHDQTVMRYYYSANPAHIAQARANAEAERIAEETKAAAHAAMMDLARPVGLELGDAWESEEGYQRETAADTLATRLTPEQIRTLAGWLGVAL